jgi:hypothetical protein
MYVRVNDDYAVLKMDQYEFYFGHEAVTEIGEWCFRVRIDGEQVVQIPESMLSKSRHNCVEYLLLGIGDFLSTYGLAGS